MLPTLMALVALVPFGDPPKEWETVSPNGGGFKIATPTNSFLTRKKAGQDEGPREAR